MLKYNLKAAVNSIKFSLRLLPIRKENYLNIIRQQYGPYVSNNLFYYGKFQLRISKVKLDLKFLKQRKNENIIPKFVQFKVPSTHLRYRRAIENCYKQILVKEIKSKSRELSRLFRHSRNLKSLIDLDLQHIHLCRVEKIINKLVAQKTLEWSNTHSKKLNKLRTVNKTSHENKRDSTISPIHNLSK